MLIWYNLHHRDEQKYIVLLHEGVSVVIFSVLQYLNTVIPYEKKGSPPSVEDLQMLTNSESLLGQSFCIRISHFALPQDG